MKKHNCPSGIWHTENGMSISTTEEKKVYFPFIRNYFDRPRQKKSFIIVLYVIFLIIGGGNGTHAQKVIVEHRKTHDFAKFRTFSFSDKSSMDATQQNQLTNAIFDQLIRDGVTRELLSKGLMKVDSSADLIVTYTWINKGMVTAAALPSTLRLGSSSDYKESTLIIDLNHRKGGLVWRIKATFDAINVNKEQTIARVIVRGLRKFGRVSRRSSDTNSEGAACCSLIFKNRLILNQEPLGWILHGEYWIAPESKAS